MARKSHSRRERAHRCVQFFVACTLNLALLAEAQAAGKLNAPGGDLCVRCEAAEIRCGETLNGSLGLEDCVRRGVPLLGSALDGQFVDPYRFEVSRSQTVEFTLTSVNDNFDTRLFVMNEECNAVIENDDCGNLPGACCRVSCVKAMLSPGTYFLWASSFSQREVGDYELSVSCADPAEVPCSNCLQGDVGCGETAEATLELGDQCSSSHDGPGADGTRVEAFRLDITSSTGALVDVDMISPNFEIDSHIVLTDENCGVLLSNDNCQPLTDKGNLDACINSFYVKAGTYYLLANNFSPGQKGSYRVSVVCSSLPTYVRANSNGDTLIDLADGISTLGYLFQGQDAPDCLDAADANDDGAVDIADVVYTLRWLFIGGNPPPPPPTPSGANYSVDDCGTDPTADNARAGDLGCESFPPCGE